MVESRTVSLVLLLTIVGPVAGEPQRVKSALMEPSVQRGLSFSKNNCARCHTIGRYGASPLRDAPPFRDLKQRYPLEDLYESLSEGIMTGHPTMPVWRLEPDQIHDLIDYMKTL